MLLTDPIARAIADGSVTVVFRRWPKPRLRTDGTFRTGVGVIRVTSIDGVAEITEPDAGAAGAASAQAARADLRGDPADPIYRIGVEWAGPDHRIGLAADANLARRTSRRWPRSPASTAAAATARGPAACSGSSATIRVSVPSLRGDIELPAFKGRVRRLKELGLTRSLEVGYELSPRGAEYLRRAARTESPRPPS